MKHIIFFILTTLFPCFTIFSQQKKFVTSYYTTENGLPSNGIKGLQWDEQNGFLWIATEAGISRFNGLDFKNFTNENTPFIEAERMLFIVKNNKGKIYASDQSGNLLYVKNNKLFPYWRTRNAKQQSPYDKAFTIAVSDTFFNDPSPSTSSKPITLLYDFT